MRWRRAEGRSCMKSLVSSKRGSVLIGMALFMLVAALLVSVSGVKADGGSSGSGSGASQCTLTGIRPPAPPNLGDFVRDRSAAIALGKALFWDVQAGSDGDYACASCHYAVGADNRARGTLAPGPNGHFDIHGTSAAELTAADFPIGPGSDDIIGSQGVFQKSFEPGPIG